MNLDTLDIRSMLGLRFRDATTERPLTDGLRVSVRRADGRGKAQTAVRTASGAYVAQQIPGLKTFERSGVTSGSGPPPVEVWVSVAHRQGWYVPVRLKANVPYEPDPAKGGLFPITEMPEGSDEEKREPTCYLFSSVQRPVRPGQGVVYADLVTGTSGGDLNPASHAVLEVQYDPKSQTVNDTNTNGTGEDRSGENGSNDDPNATDKRGSTWYGIADEQGRVAVHFPLPSMQLEELRAPSGNGGGTGNANTSNTGGGRSLSTRTWPLTVRVRYNPSVFENGSNRPFLTSILGQEPGTLYPETGTTTSDLSATLAYGEPLVLQTEGLSRTVLRIDPHAS